MSFFLYFHHLAWISGWWLAWPHSSLWSSSQCVNAVSSFVSWLNFYITSNLLLSEFLFSLVCCDVYCSSFLLSFDCLLWLFCIRFYKEILLLPSLWNGCHAWQNGVFNSDTFIVVPDALNRLSSWPLLMLLISFDFIWSASLPFMLHTSDLGACLSSQFLYLCQ